MWISLVCSLFLPAAPSISIVWPTGHYCHAPFQCNWRKWWRTAAHFGTRQTRPLVLSVTGGGRKGKEIVNLSAYSHIIGCWHLPGRWMAVPATCTTTGTRYWFELLRAKGLFRPLGKSQRPDWHGFHSFLPVRPLFDLAHALIGWFGGVNLPFPLKTQCVHVCGCGCVCVCVCVCVTTGNETAFISSRGLNCFYLPKELVIFPFFPPPPHLYLERVSVFIWSFCNSPVMFSWAIVRQEMKAPVSSSHSRNLSLQRVTRAICWFPRIFYGNWFILLFASPHPSHVRSPPASLYFTYIQSTHLAVASSILFRSDCARRESQSSEQKRQIKSNFSSKSKKAKLNKKNPSENGFEQNKSNRSQRHRSAPVTTVERSFPLGVTGK